MTLLRDERGLALLYTAILLPVFVMLLALVVELGALRVAKARLVSAADLAATAATTEQDRAVLAATGRYELAPSAEQVARDMLALELRPLAPLLAGTTPDSVAAGADVAVRRGGAPQVRVGFRAPVRTPLLVLAGLRETTELAIAVTAAPR